MGCALLTKPRESRRSKLLVALPKDTELLCNFSVDYNNNKELNKLLAGVTIAQGGRLSAQHPGSTSPQDDREEISTFLSSSSSHPASYEATNSYERLFNLKPIN